MRILKPLSIAVLLALIVLPLWESAMMQQSIFIVFPGGDLQAAINEAQPGDTIKLESNSDYVCPDGGCVLPVKAGSTYITITSSRADEIVGRATPSDAHLLARVRSLRSADPTFRTVPGSHHWKLEGLEILPAPGEQAFDIVRLGASNSEQWTQQHTLEQVPHHFILDKLWIHGGKTQEVQRGVALNSAETTISNSTISEVHGVGYETQGVAGWNGPGPFWLINNNIQAAGVNVMFGGEDPAIENLSPSNIDIRENYIAKPLSWKAGDPSYAGIHWSIKNLLEIKMGRNVIIDGNILENSWGDAQIGYCVLFTTRNQNGKAPWAVIENVSFTNNLVSNCEQGFQLQGKDWPNISERASGLLIHNNLFTGILNRFLTMNGYYNVTMTHNTHEQGGNIMSLHGDQSLGFIYNNNVTLRDPNPDAYGVFGDGVGEGTVALNTYTPDYAFAGNVIAGAVESRYPPNNFYPVNLSSVGTLRGTDGLVPGFLGLPISGPSPEPTPLPSPSPSPTATPTPSPTPAPVPAIRVVSWPNSKAKQNIIADEQWTERFRFKRNLSGQLAEFERVP